MKKILTLLIMLVIAISTLQAQEEKLRVAVFDPTTSGIAMDEGTKLAVQELISSTFVNTGKFTMVERSMIDKIMREQAFQNSDMADNSQATEIGKLAGANKIVLSAVSLVGGRNMLSIKIIDVQTATVDQQKTKIVSSNDLLDVVEPLALELLGEKAVYAKQETQFITQDKKDNTQANVFPQTNSIYTTFNELGLMITNKNLGDVTWDNAKELCAGLEIGGFSDWYLPSKNELVMIFQIENKRFKDGLSGFWYWSSTAIGDKKAYNISKSGWTSDEKKKSNSPGCLCVRKIKQ